MHWIKSIYAALIKTLSVSRILLTIRKDFIRRCNFLYSSCTFYMQFILTAGERIWKWIGKFVKKEYVSTEMNCRQISVIVHRSANLLVFRLSLSIISPQWLVSVKSYPIKDLLVSIALGWVHVVRESKCKRRFVNDKHVSSKPSKCLYTVICLSKRKSTLTECLSVHNFGQTREFLFVVRVYDVCLREQNGRRHVNCIF